MKFSNFFSFIKSHKKYFFIAVLILPVILSLFTLATTLARASWGTWGDASLIHACKDARGRITIVSSSDTCNQNESQITWLKDVEAGDGLTKTSSSSGVILSVTNQNDTTGWVASSDTWTYASATSFTISGVDRTSAYTPGTKLKFTNNGSTKYGYVKSSSFSTNTTVNLVDNTDYSLNNSAITNPKYSYVSNPQGFPAYFNLSTANITGFSSISGYTFIMAVEGKTVHLVMDIQGGSNATTFTIPAPINTYPVDQHSMPVVVIDGSAHQSSPGVIGFSTSGDGSTINVGKSLSSGQGNSFGGFTASSGKGVVGQFFYPIQ